MGICFDKRRVLISSGPMRTEIDSVRYIQNRSSGRFGLAIAREAKRLGASVHILLGPVSSEIALGYREFETSHYSGPHDYAALLKRLWPDHDDFFSMAAVLDFEVLPRAGKISREALGGTLDLKIQNVPDFVAWAGQTKTENQRVIAFAAEVGTPAQICERARKKMHQKRANAIVANPVCADRGPEALQNEVWVLREGRADAHFGPADKSELARPILETLSEN